MSNIATVITTKAGEALIAQMQAENKVLVIDKFIFANVPNRPAFPNRDDVVPTEHVVHESAVHEQGRLTENSVIYSTTLASNVGPFSFNWSGLFCSEHNVLVAINFPPPVDKTVDAPGITGNTLVRSFVLEYKGIAETTNITVDPSSWQYDAHKRMSKMDNDTAQAIIDQNGKDWFIDDGFIVTPQSGAYSIKAGAGYVSGHRISLDFDRIIHVPEKPAFIYVDAFREGSPTGEWQTKFTFVVAADEKDDYTDAQGVKHFVCKISQVFEDGSVASLRKKDKLDNYVDSINNLHTTRYAIEWRPKLKVKTKDSLQLFSHTDDHGVKNYYVPNVDLLPFVTGETFNDDNWILSSLATKNDIVTIDNSIKNLVVESEIYMPGDNVFAYRIPTIAEFNGLLFCGSEERHNSKDDPAIGNSKINYVYSIYSKDLQLQATYTLFNAISNSVVSYSNGSWFELNNELYVVCLKVLEKEYPLTDAVTDIVYKKTRDGVNWSNEVSLKPQLGWGLHYPSPSTPPLIINGTVYIPSDNGGLIITDGVTWYYNSIGKGYLWGETSITVDKYNNIIAFRRNDVGYTSMQYKYSKDLLSYSYLQTSGMIRNANCQSCIIKINDSLWLQSGQNSDSVRSNLVIRAYNDPTSVPFSAVNIYNVGTPELLKNIEDKHHGYSSLYFDGNDLFLIYEWFGRIKLRKMSVENLFNASQSNETLINDTLKQAVLENGKCFYADQRYTAVEVWKAGTGKVIERVCSPKNEITFMARQCWFALTTHKDPSDSELVQSYIGDCSVFEGESLILKRRSPEYPWYLFAIHRNERVTEGDYPLSGGFIDITNTINGYVSMSRTSSNHPDLITSIVGFKNDQNLRVYNYAASNLTFTIDQGIHGVLDLTIASKGRVEFAKQNGRIWVVSASNEV
ncbi:phage tail protein [Photobacterium phosphoreum]|uniref:phage tail-collar fiber domain-containing protein n=1 Tax=Photobacterium phosphoreum TaxID=659 RepID=UPI0007F93E1C|nr:phage tail protein [Photobacterium phosphoreum]OBU37406.1 hypothetical protein AYY24_11310 [Photobacterium phosphoreum]PSW38037.1 hypothetical protein CTM87_05695 [Photobacterium phosphoreum]